MSQTGFESSSIVETYRQRTPGSAVLFEEACSMFPSGITHDSRFLKPYGIYAAKAQGAHKWDVDGNEYVDYTGGTAPCCWGTHILRFVRPYRWRFRQGPILVTAMNTKLAGRESFNVWCLAPIKFDLRPPVRRQHTWHFVLREPTPERIRSSDCRVISMDGMTT